MFDFKEIFKESEFDPLLVQENAPFTQSFMYGKWQEMAGRKVRRFEIKKRGEVTGFFQVIKYSLPLSKNILYIPHGPITIHNIEFLETFHKKLIEIGKEENAIFVRFDFYLLKSDFKNPRSQTSNSFLEKYFKKVSDYAYHSSYFQPKYEWILDLNKTESELINAMHPKNRYNIRLAEKKGIEIEFVKSNFNKYLEKFYTLLKETAKRDNFNLHPKDYYRNIFQKLDSNNAFLAVANYNDKILAINLILLYGETAYFVFGGSSDEFKNLMAPHLLHWKTIIEVKKIGLKVYNFGAIGEEFEGISRFKKYFGGELSEYSDSYDLILNNFWYYLYNLRKWLLNQK